MEASTEINLTETEQKILKAYHRLEELQLNVALLKNRGTILLDESASVSEKDIDTAQDELLKARASFQIRSNVTENVLITSPIISSVYAGKNASTYEQDLLALMKNRDNVSLLLLDLSKKEQDAKEKLIKLEVEHSQIVNENSSLASKMVRMAEMINDQESAQIEGSIACQEVIEAERAMKISHRNWKFVKETVSAIIVGSGVDWVRDPKLLQIVLNKED